MRCSWGHSFLRGAVTTVTRIARNRVLDVRIDLVGARLQVSNRRASRRCGQLLLFGGEALALGASSALFGFGTLTVSFELADLGEVASVAGLATTRVCLGLLPSFRRDRESRDYHDEQDDHDGYPDCSVCSKHLRLPFVEGEKAWVRGSVA
jgi:hypothetical protein